MHYWNYDYYSKTKLTNEWFIHIHVEQSQQACNIYYIKCPDCVITTDIIWFSIDYTGDPPDNRPGDGAEDEQAALEPAEYVAGGATSEQVVASEYFKVSRGGWSSWLY